ncbi:MAG TPA: NAD+ synthase [Nitrososphaera sp.]|jgi:NAD+ synthase
MTGRTRDNSAILSKKIKRFISSYASSHAKGLVLGLSGGLDSSVVLKLCVIALGPQKVFGLVMSNHITPPQDITDAVELAKSLSVRYQIIDLDPIIEKYSQILPENERARGNLTARIRMNILYYYAAINSYLVAGTSDKSERKIGFFTKFGDGAADILPIGDLYKTQVRELAHFLQIPQAIIEKKSSPRLWDNHLAEEEIGMTYEKIDPILQLLEKKNKPQEIARKLKVPLSDVRKVKEMVEKSEHKRDPPPIAKI